MIYFVECIGADAIKIGLTVGNGNGLAHSRVSSMQSNCPMPLKLMAAIEGDKAMERALHARFSDDWLRGEWFRATDALRSFIAQFPVPPPPPRQGDKRYNRRPRNMNIAAPPCAATGWSQAPDTPAHLFTLLEP